MKSNNWGIQNGKMKKWIPIDDLPQTIYYEHTLDNSYGITLLFSDIIGNKNIEVIFDSGVLSYRNTDEGSLFKTLSFLKKHMEQIFIVNHSEYIDWFNKESISIY